MKEFESGFVGWEDEAERARRREAERRSNRELEDEDFDGDFDEDFDEEALARFDAVVQWYGSLPRPSVYLLNPLRLKDMYDCAHLLDRVMQENFCAARVSLEECEADPSIGAVRVEVDSFETGNLTDFCRAASLADATDIFPLVNGNLCMEFTFHGLRHGLA